MGKNTGKGIPPGNCSPPSFLKGTYSESMFLSAVTSNEVEDFISQMDNNKSIGPFCIPVLLLKILKIRIAPLLSSLINDSFLCGTFHNKLELAKLLQSLRTFAPIATEDFLAHVTHTSCIADHKGKHDAKGANIFHKNGT